MRRCVVVDDEAGAIEVLKGYIQRTPQLELVKTFRSSVEALDYLVNHPVDLLFLDIDMPELGGLQLADVLRSRPVAVVFCTAHPEYAARSYDVDAVDYLLKPVGYDRFLKAVVKVEQMEQHGRVEEQIQSTPGRMVFIKSGPDIHQLDTDQLLYAKKDGHYIIFHTSDRQLLSRMNMRELLDMLPESNFARTHKSWVVALDKIDVIQRSFVTIQGLDIPIGDSYRKAFFQRIKHKGS